MSTHRCPFLSPDGNVNEDSSTRLSDSIPPGLSDSSLRLRESIIPLSTKKK